MPQRENSQPQAYKTFMDASQSQSMSRRGFGGLLLVGVTSALLVACGGGSDPTGVTSSSSTQSYELRNAYNKINYEMTGDELINIVGRVPNELNGTGQKNWSNSTESLRVSLQLDNNSVWRVDGASYSANDGVELHKDVD